MTKEFEEGCETANAIIECVDVIELARQFDVDQYDILERFVCELLNISPNLLYQLIDGECI